jgi:hypothetical protein
MVHETGPEFEAQGDPDAPHQSIIARYERLSEEFNTLRVRFRISHEGAAATWNFAMENASVFLAFKESGCKGTSYRTARRSITELMVPVYLTVRHRDKRTGTVEVYKGSTFPRKQYEGQNWEHLATVTEVSATVVRGIHNVVHGKDDEDGTQTEVIFSCDGVPQSHSGESVTIIGIQFVGCRSVYHLKILSAEHQYRLDLLQEVQDTLDDLTAAGLRVLRLQADAPMRASLTCRKGPTSINACDLCTKTADIHEMPLEVLYGRGPNVRGRGRGSRARGQSRGRARGRTTRASGSGSGSGSGSISDSSVSSVCEDDDGNNVSVRKRYWGFNAGAEFPLRTHDQIVAIVDDIENVPELERKGVVGRSPFLDLPGFDIVRGT